jgi:peptide/nickel transport system ATP-binding protein
VVVSDLGVVFGRKERALWAVTNVSLSVEAGSTTAIVGESGSGKTTLGRAICGLQPISTGTVSVGGVTVPRRDGADMREWRKRTVFVFQDAIGSLSPHQTAMDAVAEVVRRKHKCSNAKARLLAEALLTTVELPSEAMGLRPSQLSGGQARRVGLARALALEPDVLVADEPTAGLDVSIQGGILNLLRSIQESRGLTMIVVSHNLATVGWLARNVVVMYMGTVVEAGPTELVLSQPLHPYTRALKAAAPGNPARLEAGLKGDAPLISGVGTGCGFRSRCPQATELCRSRPASVMVRGRHVSCHHVDVGAN